MASTSLTEKSSAQTSVVVSPLRYLGTSDVASAFSTVPRSRVGGDAAGANSQKPPGGQDPAGGASCDTRCERIHHDF